MLNSNSIQNNQIAIKLEQLINANSDIEIIESDIKKDLLTERGVNLFVELLMNNYTLAYIFIPKIDNLYDVDKFLYELINCNVSISNMFYVCQFVDKLSRRKDMISFIRIAIENNKLEYVDACCMKYRDSQKSTELFNEIRKVIEMMQNVFISFLSENRNGNNYSLFSILYSLLYQDIHPFFEDNLELILNKCAALYQSEFTIIQQIFELLLVKYSEFINVDSILNILLSTSIDINNYELPMWIKLVTIGYSYSKNNRQELIKQLFRLITQYRDMIDYTPTGLTAILSETDILSQIHEIIRMLQPTIDECSICNDSSVIFYVTAILSTSTKIDLFIIDKAQLILTENRSDTYTKFSAFLLLIKTNSNYLPSFDYFNDEDLVFICSKLIVDFLRRNSMFYANKLNLNTKTNKNAIFVCTDLIKHLLEANKHFNDKYTAALLVQLHKEGYIETKDYKIIFDAINTLLNNKIGNITDISCVAMYFDIYMSLCKSLNYYDNPLVNKIMTEEIVEMYNFMIYYISMNVDKVDEDLILNILSQNVFYTQKQLLLPMSCLLLGSYKQRIITAEQLSVANSQIHVPILYMELNKLKMVEMGVKTTVMELDYLVNNKEDPKLYTTYLNGKYVRRVLLKMMEEGVDENKIREVYNKNREAVEFEYTLHAITDHFDL